MKLAPLIAFVLYAAYSLPLLAETPDELAVQIIKSDHRGLVVAGHVGTYNNDQLKANQAVYSSANMLNKFMLSKYVSEELRLSYALSILGRQDPTSPDDKATLLQKKLIFGTRFLELTKEAEQGAAANP